MDLSNLYSHICMSTKLSNVLYKHKVLLLIFNEKKTKQKTYFTISANSNR